ncbi:MAG: 7-cyano-7-deazaguanine synthase QueC [Planctomycetota bacterium]|nr:7-cyano-7-deazaguanine synthase QueC [Planctomycetota bacterium]MDW8373419.1 7-cyano-7-deazaguanine synthase QueC [Planctomycetota bacterium]
MTREPAIVVLSGGQDSTTCLAWALRRFAPVDAITFDYGQRHRIELACAAEIARRAGVRRHRVVAVPSLADLGRNALIDSGEAPAALGASGERGLPNTFVPGRNVLFLTLAAAWAWQQGIHHLVIGVCQTDYSGYPDCRAETIAAVERALSLGLDWPLSIHTPLMHLTKADSIRLAIAEGAWEWLAYTHTCYDGAVPPCGVCAACRLRARGFAEAGVPDPLLVRLGVTEAAPPPCAPSAPAG